MTAMTVMTIADKTGLSLLSVCLELYFTGCFLRVFISVLVLVTVIIDVIASCKVQTHLREPQ